MTQVDPNYFNNQVMINNQPTFQPNAFVVTQVQVPAQKREWSESLCSCCSDCSECCYAYWCFPCYACSLFSRNSEDCCSYLFGGLVPLRTKIRTERGIEGSICNDWWCIFCCTFCATIQMGREIKGTVPSI